MYKRLTLAVIGTALLLNPWSSSQVMAAPPPAAAEPVADADAAMNALHQAIQQLQAQVAALKEENAQLRRQLAQVRRAAAAQSEPAAAVPAAQGNPAAQGSSAPPPAQAPAPAANAQGASDPANKIQRGMTLREARQILGDPSGLSNTGGHTRRATWKGFRDGSVFRVITADIDANGVISDFTEAQD